MHRIPAILSCFLLLAAGSALADSAASQPDEEKLICKRAQNTGSRLPAKRVCRTAEQWQREADEARRVTQEMQHLRHGPKGN